MWHYIKSGSMGEPKLEKQIPFNLKKSSKTRAKSTINLMKRFCAKDHLKWLEHTQAHGDFLKEKLCALWGLILSLFFPSLGNFLLSRCLSYIFADILTSHLPRLSGIWGTVCALRHHDTRHNLNRTRRVGYDVFLRVFLLCLVWWRLTVCN